MAPSLPVNIYFFNSLHLEAKDVFLPKKLQVKMSIFDKIADVQQSIKKFGFDGWLLYDFRKTNDLACGFLEIPSHKMLSRRFFYWIPQKGDPIKIVNRIEKSILDHLPGKIHVYSSWNELQETLASVLKGSSKVAMEYSPDNAIPYVSKVDAGTIDLVRKQGVEVVSSADLMQSYTSVWTPSQLNMHLEAAQVVDTAVAKAWEFIASHIKANKPITESDVQNFILNQFKENECVTDHPPICAVNAHAADPHYSGDSITAVPIHAGDFVLIDLWCKKNKPLAVYADITRVGVVASQPTEKQQKIFNIVKEARNAAMTLLNERVSKGEQIKGWEVDRVCRNVIINAGYGEFFTHRTGHNIGENDHGNGAHIDDFETKDLRVLLPATCFSIEPGIYLPGEFGVRLEHDVYIEADGRSLRITGGLQEELVCLL